MMALISPILRSVQGPGLAFWCAPCGERHVIGIGPGAWSWNGDAERPVFGPSVLVRGHKLARDEAGRWTGDWVRDAAGGLVPTVCHSFVGCNGAQPGQIIYLGDCTHELAGQIVGMAPFPPREEGDG